ncbi:envelope biogenesis factor ElyC [Psychromonas sp. RZ22]|uniref:ElyC/SanA/YdcF family protein n=1 Tax=Psychromonas algarum TaxID=2555643 RepID=UPI001067D38F|nr:ElyC/SanA/YdcF family protein [Psychromonas sp. RZ22]TEW56168.1 envelope biogenesis factor ElyC [Psychromonas sp. RZ22]
MLFLIKKWIGGLLMPLPFSLLLLFISLLLLFFTQRQKTAKILVLCSFIILFSFSVLPNANHLVKPLERQYPDLINAHQSLDYILVLGSSGIHDQSIPITGQLSFTALSRFSEALRLYYANPNAYIVVSGSGFGDTQSHAQLLQTLAISFTIPRQRIIRLDDTKDTNQEAQQMATIIDGKKAALVTSATHMPRAMKLFKQYNQTPIPAPAMYLAKENNHKLPSYIYIPSAYQLYKSQVALHEYLGQLQAWFLR